ncbi:filaggrin-2 isoform X1 [Drosophila suzukii]|uniref:Filaggrin-2 isoform X1 n=1 Tax=Drosophila suzukii TaxID=28584 RepID=A0AB40A3Q3_DROSZ
MLSSLASYLFGSPATSESVSQEANPAQNPNATNSNPGPTSDPSAGDVIEVTSSTPSVAGSTRGAVRASNGKRGKNRRGKQQQRTSQQQQQQRKQPSITKLLTPSGETIDEDFDEDEWYIVEKEDEEDDSLPRSDSEEELSVVEVSHSRGGATASSAAGHGPVASSRRRQHLNSHSLYSGPRPQQQRNYLQRSRVARPLSISTLSPPRSVPAQGSSADPDNLSQSLYVASPSGSDQGQGQGQGQGLGQGANVLMEESWYVTPPPCFTSIGPINMETSPFENLLIEHPSMSVYRSIRSTQEGTESFVNLDLGVSAEVPQQREDPEPEAEPQDQRQALQEQRSHNARFDRHAAAQLKQQTLARQSQKSNNMKQHQQLCRSAIKRANKVRDFQAKANRPRRSEMQHCKLVSGANNNRSKCCY